MRRVSYILGSFIVAAFVFTGCSSKQSPQTRSTISLNDVDSRINSRIGPIDSRLGQVDSRLTKGEKGLEEVKLGLNDLEGRLPKLGDVLDYQAVFTFDNFDWVEGSADERRKRQQFSKELNNWINRRASGCKKCQIENTGLNANGLIQKFTLTGLPKDEQEKIKKKIGELQQKYGVPIRVDEDKDPLAFQRVTRKHNSVSGRSEVTVSTEENRTCVATTTFTVEGIPKSGAAAYVYDSIPRPPGSDVPVFRELRDSFTIPHACTQKLEEILKDVPDKNAYILVKLTEDVPKDVPVVAQYRSINLLSRTDKHHEVPLTEAAAACPETAYPLIPEPAAEAFRSELEDCS